jgi:hypothetical protein
VTEVETKQAKLHYGDPCIHCGTAHDAVAPGPCQGTGKPKPIAFFSFGVRWDNVEHFRVRFSDGHVEDRWAHIGENAPYYHFGHSDTLIAPPTYDDRLRAGGPFRAADAIKDIRKDLQEIARAEGTS